MAWRDLAERLQEDLNKKNDTIAALQRKLKSDSSITNTKIERLRTINGSLTRQLDAENLEHEQNQLYEVQLTQAL
jgi:hypothetical protein